VQYPQRGFCGNCLSAQVAPGPVPATGRLLSWTLLHASSDPRFRERGPWRIGLVALDRGPVLFVHLGADVATGQQVEVEAVARPSSPSVWLAWKAGEPAPGALRAAVEDTR
jgi:uncharacterized OB-fold protein